MSQKVILPDLGVNMLVLFQYARETQNNVRRVISYNIVASYHVYLPRSLYMNENRLSCVKMAIFYTYVL